MRIALENLFGPGQDFSQLPWQPFREGVDIVRLYGDGNSGPSAALLRYVPGARLPPHRHTDFEHIVVLHGAQRDERGTYTAGTLLVHGSGTGHNVVSDDGCIVLAIWNAPVEFG